MEKKSPPLPESKFKFLYFLPKAIMSSGPSPRTPTPRMNKKKKKKKKKKTARSALMSVNNNGSFRFRGPRSPKVSCIGYVVNKGNYKKRKNDSEGKEHSNEVAASHSNPSLIILKLLKVFKKKGTKLANPYEVSSSYSPPGAAHQKSVPKLGNAKKFFEWRRVHDSSAAVAPDRPSTLSNKRKEKRNGRVAVEIENIVLVPRKEINLWKKRSVSPPPPLRV